MSEYQYFEFQALDRQLTEAEMDELREVSSRGEISARRFVNVYHWGRFKGNPNRWMERYFDAFLHITNWGNHWLMFRVPEALVPREDASWYCMPEDLSCRVHGNDLILSFWSEEEAPDPEEGEGWLSSLIPIRDDLMRGDLRALYLAWLSCAPWDELDQDDLDEDDLDEDDLEPPVPPGLGELSAPLQRFADFLRVDGDLIAAAAEGSEPLTAGPSKKALARWVAKLPAAEKDAFIVGTLEAEAPHLAAELRQRAIRELRGAGKRGGDDGSGSRRKVGWLLARGKEIKGERKKKAAEVLTKEKAKYAREEAARRKRYLEMLARNEDHHWSEVDRLIASRQPGKYDQAVTLLVDLRDIAEMNGMSTAFSDRMRALHSAHARKGTLMDRFRKAGFVG